MKPECNLWTSKARTRTALRRLILAAQEKLHEERCQAKWIRDKLADKPNEQCSALDLVDEIKRYDPENAWDIRNDSIYPSQSFTEDQSTIRSSGKESLAMGTVTVTIVTASWPEAREESAPCLFPGR